MRHERDPVLAFRQRGIDTQRMPPNLAIARCLQVDSRAGQVVELWALNVEC